MNVGECANKSVGATHMHVGDHGNPVSGHHQALSHWKTTSIGKGGTRCRGKYSSPKGWEGQCTRMARNWIEMRRVDWTRGLLENKGAMTITNAPEPPGLPHTSYQVKSLTSIVSCLTLPKLHLASFNHFEKGSPLRSTYYMYCIHSPFNQRQFKMSKALEIHLI